MVPDWKQYVHGINRLFVEICANLLFIPWKKGIKFGPEKKQLSLDECIERLAKFINEHSHNTLPLELCRICARYIWSKLIEKHGGKDE